MVDERPQGERVVASLTGSRLAAELVRNRRISNKECRMMKLGFEIHVRVTRYPSRAKLRGLSLPSAFIIPCSIFDIVVPWFTPDPNDHPTIAKVK